MNGNARLTVAGLRQLVEKWDRTNPDDDPAAAAKFEMILDRLEWFGANHWAEYDPANHPEHSAQYLTRLAEWVGNVANEEDQKLLLEYALHIAFFSRADLCALYRTAFSGPISRWVIAQEKLTLDDPGFQSRLADELHHRTWYCPVTDSMKINEFYHANLITGISHRPDFAALKMLDDRSSAKTGATASNVVDGLRNFIANPKSYPAASAAPPLKRLVLLEDFVGTGTQSAEAIEWAARNVGLPILFVPLVVCVPGMKRLAKIAKAFAAKVKIHPLLQLGERDLLGPNRNNADGIANAKHLETLANRTFEQVTGGPHTNERQAPQTPFGFKKTGASFVSYSNTPNNTLPMIHHQPASGGWRPLFPRSARV